MVDSDNRLLGVVNSGRSLSCLSSPFVATAGPGRRPDAERRTTADARRHPGPGLELFVENDLLTLPVVTNLEERQVIGMVSRFDISSAYLRHVHGPAVARDG